MEHKKGFTLVELLAVISILAILTILAIPNIINFYNESKLKTNYINTQYIVKIAQKLYLQNPNSYFESEENIYNKL